MRAAFYCACLLIGTPLLLAADDTRFDEAVTAFQNQDYKTAAAGFEELLDERPSWAPGHVLLGRCYYLLGDPALGERSLGAAIKLDPQTDLFKVYYGTAQELVAQKQYARAIPPYEKAAEHAPQARRKSVLFRQAHNYQLAQRYEDAQKAWSAWESRYEATGDSSYFLALTCQKRDYYPCALSALRVALQKGPTEDRAGKATEYLARWSHYWALLPESRPRRDELIGQATTDTSQWYEAEPRNPVALRYFVETLLAAGRGQVAVDLLVPLAKADPDDCPALTLLARAFNALGNGPQAENAAAKALRCAPNSADVHIELAVARIHQLRSEHTNIDAVRDDLQRVREAVDSIRAAKRLDSDLGSRVDTLLADAQVTLERLIQVEEELVAQDARDDKIASDLHEKELRDRCQSIHWNIQHSPQRVTAEEESFYAAQDCRQYVR